jgi:hypothetical protein
MVILAEARGVLTPEKRGPPRGAGMVRKRGGRDPGIDSSCYVLNDLEKQN